MNEIRAVGPLLVTVSRVPSMTRWVQPAGFCAESPLTYRDGVALRLWGKRFLFVMADGRRRSRAEVKRLETLLRRASEIADEGRPDDACDFLREEADRP